MTKDYGERRQAERSKRLAKMQAQIDEGRLTVRQMTPEERALWDERSAESDRHLRPDVLANRRAALEKRRRIQAKWREQPETPADPGHEPPQDRV